MWYSCVSLERSKQVIIVWAVRDARDAPLTSLWRGTPADQRGSSRL